jgi:hypothetical protein
MPSCRALSLSPASGSAAGGWQSVALREREQRRRQSHRVLQIDGRSTLPVVVTAAGASQRQDAGEYEPRTSPIHMTDSGESASASKGRPLPGASSTCRELRLSVGDPDGGVVIAGRVRAGRRRLEACDGLVGGGRCRVARGSAAGAGGSPARGCIRARGDVGAVRRSRCLRRSARG